MREGDMRSDEIGPLIETILIVVVTVIAAGAFLLTLDGAIRWGRRAIGLEARQ
jgi:hypothetical protein